MRDDADQGDARGGGGLIHRPSRSPDQPVAPGLASKGVPRAVWPRLSIQARLNALIGALLILGLTANIVGIIWSGGPRIAAETASVIKLTHRAVDRTIQQMQTSKDPRRDLAMMLDRLSGLRHAQVWFQAPFATSDSYWDLPTGPPRPRPDTSYIAVPTWFSRFVYAAKPPILIPVRVMEELLGTIVIEANPRDEIAEIWDAVLTTLAVGLLLIAIVFALTTVAVRQALMPIHRLGKAMSTMTAGVFDVSLQKTGPPELADITGRLIDLAASLNETRCQNARLAQQMITIEDRERRELARELHDEFGPLLFAVRANLTSLMREAVAETNDEKAPARVVKCRVALDHVGALQQLNKRVLHKLRPPALRELGLERALRALIATWADHDPSIEITLAMPPLVRGLDETTELTVYRVVQEGLTNAFRHANATKIAVVIAALSSHQLCVTVSDDGAGMGADSEPGSGLSGMAERVWALGGTIKMTNAAAHGGFELRVELPVRASTGLASELKHLA